MDFETARPLIGRSPPHSVEAEEYLLSCALIDGIEVIALCLEMRISSAFFYVPANRVIYEKLLELYGANKPIDLAVLSEELKTSGQLEQIGGYAYLTQISSRIPTTAQARYFAEKIRELHLLRELIKVGGTAVEECYKYTGNIDEFVDKIERDLFAVTQERVGDGAKIARHAMAEAAAMIDFMIDQKGQLTGVSSGFKDLDTFLYGFQRQNLIILAARPSMGKTSLALNFIEHALFPKRGPATPALIFSLEMSQRELAMRLISSNARVNFTQLREGFIGRKSPEVERYREAKEKFDSAPLFIDDASSPTIMEIRAKARRVHQRKKLGLIVVDYLQLLAPMDARQPREQQVSEASRGLKALAKELDVPVIVLSQLNRASEKENRTPKLSDLRESGAIEQDADIVLMMARPKEADDRFQVAADTVELVIAKNRNGAVGDLKLAFLSHITRFENFCR